MLKGADVIRRRVSKMYGKTFIRGSKVQDAESFVMQADREGSDCQPMTLFSE